MDMNDDGEAHYADDFHTNFHSMVGDGKWSTVTLDPSGSSKNIGANDGTVLFMFAIRLDTVDDVVYIDLRVAAGLCQPLRLLNRFLGFNCKSIKLHHTPRLLS